MFRFLKRFRYGKLGGGDVARLADIADLLMIARKDLMNKKFVTTLGALSLSLDRISLLQDELKHSKEIHAYRKSVYELAEKVARYEFFIQNELNVMRTIVAAFERRGAHTGSLKGMIVRYRNVLEGASHE